MINKMSFHFSHSQSPNVFDQPDEEVARHGSQEDKGNLAGRENLAREVFLILEGTNDSDVLASLVMNYTTPSDILDRIAANHPELHEYAATNPSASVELMKTAPLSEHIPSSVEEFLNQVHATDDEARALVKQQDKLRPPGGPLLGEVWAQIRPEKL